MESSTILLIAAGFASGFGFAAFISKARHTADEMRIRDLSERLDSQTAPLQTSTRDSNNRRMDITNSGNTTNNIIVTSPEHMNHVAGLLANRS